MYNESDIIASDRRDTLSINTWFAMLRAALEEEHRDARFPSVIAEALNRTNYRQLRFSTKTQNNSHKPMQP